MSITRATLRLAAASLAVTLSLATPVSAESEQPPKPGGTLEVGTVYVTLSALSWDSADWNWKHNHDTGQVYEQLFVADLSKSRRLGGKHPFYADAWIPSDAIRGELAEKWEWKQNPLRLEINLRKGVMFPDKPGVMAARELVADDVVFAYNRLEKSPKKISGYFDHLEKVEATDKHTVVFTFKNYNAEWDYRFGWGYYSGIVPKEVADAGAGNWKNVNGTGPFQLAEFVQGNSNTYVKNPVYWGTEKINGVETKLPLVDKVVFRTIKDEATYLTALRTAKLDILETIRWSAVEELKKNAPQLQWSKWLNMSGTFLSMRVDTKPFDDIRVRRALNLAVNKQEIVKEYYGGNAELFAYPQHPDYLGYFEPLEAMPDSVKELFTYNPEKAKKLLAEAGVPKGFTFKVQVCSCSPRPHRPDTAARRLLRAGRRQDRDPDHGIRCISLGHDQQDQCRGISDEQWAHQSDDDHPQELREGPGVESVAVERSRIRQEDGRRLSRAGREQTPGPVEGDDPGDPGQGTLRLASHAVHLYGLVALGEELRRRVARRRRPSGADLRPHLDRSGSQEEDGPLGGSAVTRPLLEVNHLTTRFYTERGSVTAVDDVSFHVDPGETLAIVGESGSGKSVTALSVLRLIPNPPGRIESGEILFDGVDLVKLDDPGIRAIRGNKIAMIFQEPMSSLNPALTVGLQVAEPINVHRGTSWAKAYEAATELIGRVRIADAASRLGSYPHQYSGGMRQRVMIAMALACAPRLIIADEPTTALDVTVQAQILDLLKELTRETGSSLILITHDLGVVARYADRVAVMYGGRIVEVAPARELYARPQHPYTLGLMASVPRLDGASGRRLVPIEGQPPDLASLPPGCSFAPRCRSVIAQCRTSRPELVLVADHHAKACFAHV